MARHHIAWILVVVGLWTTGCSRNPSGPGTSTAEDRAAIVRALETSPELAVDFTDDAGELLGSADPSTRTSETTGNLLAPADTGITADAPIRWGRRRIPSGREAERTIDFLVPPDSGRALVRVTVRFEGWLFVDRTDDGLRNPGKKPLREQATRVAMFRKVWFHPEPSSADSVFGWRLVALSPVRFTMTDPARQSVAIQSVTVTTPGARTTVTDPAALLALRGGGASMPATRIGQTVKVEAAVTNSDKSYRPSEFVFLHVPVNARAVPGPFDRVRMRMRDDGSAGDAAAGDGVYTAEWKVQDVGRHHLAVDVLNAGSLMTEAGDDYNSTAWGIPYASHPAL